MTVADVIRQDTPRVSPRSIVASRQRDCRFDIMRKIDGARIIVQSLAIGAQGRWRCLRRTDTWKTGETGFQKRRQGANGNAFEIDVRRGMVGSYVALRSDGAKPTLSRYSQCAGTSGVW